MLPNLATNDAADARASHGRVFSSQGALSNSASSISFSDRANVISADYSVVSRLSLAVTAFRDHICVIFLPCSLKQMLWVNTSWYVTPVQYVKLWHFAVSKKIRSHMRFATAIARAAITVPVSVCAERPQPACWSFYHSGPEILSSEKFKLAVVETYSTAIANTLFQSVGWTGKHLVTLFAAECYRCYSQGMNLPNRFVFWSGSRDVLPSFGPSLS